LFFSSRRRHTRFSRDWSSDVCSSDLRGKSRKITPEMEDRIREKIEQFPRAKASVLYDELVDDGVFSPATVSLTTFYRYLSARPEIGRASCRERAQTAVAAAPHAIDKT